jgi:hypothetical protein
MALPHIYREKFKEGACAPSRCYFWQHGQWQSPLQHVAGSQQLPAAVIDTAPPTSSAVINPRVIKIFFITILLF